MDAKKITNGRLPRAVLDQLLTLGSSWEEPSDLAGLDEIFQSFVTSSHEDEQWRILDSESAPNRALLSLADSQDVTLEELNAFKQFAKANALHCNGASLPKAVASAVYFYCLAITFRRFDDCHSGLNASQIRSGWTWALAQPWLDSRCRRTLKEALDNFTTSDRK